MKRKLRINDLRLISMWKLKYPINSMIMIMVFCLLDFNQPKAKCSPLQEVVPFKGRIIYYKIKNSKHLKCIRLLNLLLSNLKKGNLPQHIT